ncbi:uncharacterized protein LOC129882518 isoform X2 [Solanum dulcamara]|uniref:uncharacterized protein LOC129882518 isoform X2 n=1 Tax=Solanum dulcamara TaxID=45834 RepID=UPI002485D62D|nr:uncharacterized protein LOC129882518 isoform X2 [Solanum dulcamara]XP_055812818.1 uncharacterized protein LOC129882518 isoform X2 [Solanum dulcamara]
MRTKQQFEKHKEVSGGSGSKSELDRYLAEDIESDSDGFDILMWWKVHEAKFPIFAEMARDVLAILISSVASEYAFCTGGRILDPFRSSLTPKLCNLLFIFKIGLEMSLFQSILRKIWSILSNLNLICSGCLVYPYTYITVLLFSKLLPPGTRSYKSALCLLPCWSFGVFVADAAVLHTGRLEAIEGKYFVIFLAIEYRIKVLGKYLFI